MTARRSLALAALLALAFLGVMAPQAGAAVTATFAGGTLTATSDGADPIAVVCDGGAVEVNGAAPVPATGCGAVQRLVVNGGPGANAINLSAVTTAAFPALTSSVVSGGGDADTITGSQIGDRVTPNTGGDTVNAGDGNDTMVWNNGDGSDVMNGEAGADTVEVNGSAAAGDAFTVNPNGQRVRFDRTNLVPFSLDIGTTESLVLNGGGGEDTMTGAAGLAGLIVTTMNGQDGNDTLTGTDGRDVVNGGPGDDRIRTRNAPPSVDDVDCGDGEDVARVDPRDRVTRCERVIGGRARVRLVGERARVVRGRARLRLRCTIQARCAGTVELRRGSRVLGRARFSATRRRVKVVRIRLSSRARRLVANAPARGLAVTVRINARDAAGNGWRTTARIRLRR